jgi:ATP-dependent helicase/nuclease subunit A
MTQQQPGADIRLGDVADTGLRGGFALPRVLVRASAGSGKTFRLSSEIIGLLARGEQADRIFASTFTRKAAGEILDRVLLRLAHAARDEVAAQELAEHTLREGSYDSGFWSGVLEGVVGQLHRLNIGTLDAFFMRMATCFSHEVGLPAQWSIADEPTAARMRTLALQDVLRDADAAELAEVIRGLVRSEGSRSVHEALLRDVEKMMSVHNALDPAVTGHWSAFDDLAAAQPQDCDVLCRELAAQLEACDIPTTGSGTPRQVWAKAVLRISDAIEQRDWAAVLGETLVQRARAGEAFDRTAVPASIAGILDDAAVLARADVAAKLARRAHATRRFTTLYAEALDRRRAELGAYGFDDITRMLSAPDPVSSRADMYYRLDMKAVHMLLDEFQDTSVPQWEALEPLALELTAGHEGERAAVIVADRKQSIYAWRGGTPDLLQRVAALGLDQESLHTSWRSSQVVLDFVNAVFNRFSDSTLWVGEERFTAVAAEWAADFPHHNAARKLPGYVELRVGPADETRGSDRPKLYRFAAAQVQALATRMPGSSIGVLTRTNKAVTRIMFYLRELGVHASAEGGTPLTDAASVNAVLALLRVADHPGHAVARYHVATSPLGAAVGFTDHLDDRAARALAHRTRRELLEQGYGATLARLAGLCGNACTAREKRRLDQLVELAFQYDGSATLRPSDFVYLVRRKSVEDPVAAHVRVMTVHKAKGLEFDIVVLPELDAELVRNSGTKYLTWRAQPGGRAQRAFPYLPESLLPLFEGVPGLRQARDEAFRSQLCDSLSAMYVALTRARHAVHIIVKPDGSSGPGTSKTAARAIREALAAGMPATEGSVLLARGEPDWFQALRTGEDMATREQSDGAADVVPSAGTESGPIRLRTTEQRTRILPRRSPSALEGGERLDLGLVLRLGASAASRRGSAAHLWFEQIGWLEDGVPNDEVLAGLARTADPDLGDDAIAAIMASFRGWLSLPVVRRALSSDGYAPHAVAEREVPFLTRDGDVVMEGIIDRLVVERSGGRATAAHVLDFKTDALTPGDHAALRQRTAHYAPQLRAYRRAVASMYGLPLDAVTARLLFLEAGELVGVE